MVALVAGAHPRPWTIEEWLALNETAPDGRRYELLDGQVIVSPPPSARHQYAADELRALLKAAAPDDLRVITAVGVRLDEDSGLIPDVVVVRRAFLRSGMKVPSAGDVRLVVEIVSPSTRTSDRSSKPQKYAAAGIPYFWRVELEDFRGRGSDELPVLFAYALDEDGAYRLTHRIAAGNRARLDAPFLVELDPAVLADY